jgi:hypothetical protein
LVSLAGPYGSGLVLPAGDGPLNGGQAGLCHCGDAKAPGGLSERSGQIGP